MIGTLIAIEAVVIGLLTILVAGLLRSHGEILLPGILGGGRCGQVTLLGEGADNLGGPLRCNAELTCRLAAANA